MEAVQTEWIIYITTNLINMKTYVGQRKLDYTSVDKRYLGSGTIFKKALKKYGRENFNREILYYAYSQSEADEIEIQYIKQIDSTNPKKGYNILKGGNCTVNPKRFKSVECIETGEIFESIAVAAKAKSVNASHITSCCKGRCDSTKGLHWKYVGEERVVYKPPIRTYKNVLCVELNVIFSSREDAAKKLNIQKTHIGAVCLGKRKTTGGYSFKYVTNRVDEHRFY